VKARVVIGGPEIERLKKGLPLVVNMKPNTTEIEIVLSRLVNLDKHGESTFAELLDVVINGREAKH
jgi:hypothetical protein